MCRLLGIVSKRVIDPRILLEFRQLAETGKNPRDFDCEQISKRVGHPDGWGIACLAGDGEIYRRSHLKATEDSQYEAAVREVSGLGSPPYILMAHLRRAARMETIKQEYNQPYRREVGGRIVFFAHNGDVEGFGVRDGRIDSQAYFERLLARIGEQPLPLAEFKKRLGEVKSSFVTEFPKKVTSLTCLMSDGEEIVGHRDSRKCLPYHSLHEARTDGLFVICSEVLSTVAGRWRLLKNDETVSFSVNEL